MFLAAMFQEQAEYFGSLHGAPDPAVLGRAHT
jgi:hypothetical protein